jgi:hypothetical protein
MAHEAISLALKLANVLYEVWRFSEVCKELRDRCLALLPILNNPSLDGNPAAGNLKTVLEECINYLKDCEDEKIRKRLAHAALEKLLIKQVPTYKEKIQNWISTVSLSVAVSLPNNCNVN